MATSAGRGLVPNFNAWLQTAWGAGAEFWSAGCAGLFSGASNLVFGQNPPYYLDDFLSVYPKFFGVPTVFTGCGTTSGSATASFTSTAGILIGQFAKCGDFPPNTVVTAVTSNSVTFNNQATATDNNATVQVYVAPPVPVAVIQLYLNLANASLIQARWQEQWYIAMAWFIAHYCTMYARSDAQEVMTTVTATTHGETPAGARPGTVFTISAAPQNGVLQALYKNGAFQTPGIDYTLNGVTITTIIAVLSTDSLWATWPITSTSTTAIPQTAAQVAAQGIATGIEISKSVGDVSASYAQLEWLKEFSQWNLTWYGVQLAAMAKVIGSGPMLIW